MDILAALSFVVAHYFRVFAAKKLGFVRWLNFNGKKLTENLPIDTVKYAALALILILAAVAAYKVVKNRAGAGIKGMIMCVIMAAAAAYCAYATVCFDYDYSQAYFLIVPVIWLGTLFLIIRSLIKNEE